MSDVSPKRPKAVSPSMTLTMSALAGYDNIAPAAWPPYRLTTVDIRLDAVTEAALSLIEPRAGEAAEALVRPRIVERASTLGSLDVA